MRVRVGGWHVVFVWAARVPVFNATVIWGYCAGCDIDDLWYPDDVLSLVGVVYCYWIGVGLCNISYKYEKRNGIAASILFFLDQFYWVWIVGVYKFLFGCGNGDDFGTWDCRILFCIVIFVPELILGFPI